MFSLAMARRKVVGARAPAIRGLQPSSAPAAAALAPADGARQGPLPCSRRRRRSSNPRQSLLQPPCCLLSFFPRPPPAKLPAGPARASSAGPRQGRLFPCSRRRRSDPLPRLLQPPLCRRHLGLLPSLRRPRCVLSLLRQPRSSRHSPLLRARRHRRAAVDPARGPSRGESAEGCCGLSRILHHEEDEGGAC
ncbi:hypothetical protein BS78_02G041800 [Paspalum vaginatum]|nr:hypothetical protein BS78_02G041800 [Paspalum vaginatum]